MIAAQNGNREICDFLISRKADTGSKDIIGEDFIFYAYANNHIQLVKHLNEKIKNPKQSSSLK